MQILEEAIPIGTRQAIHGLDRGLGFVRAKLNPCRQQRGGEVSHRPAHGLRNILPRRRILLLLDVAHAENKPGDAVVAVDLQ